MIAALENAGYGVVCPTPEETKLGAVESRSDAKACAELFRGNSDKIAGVIVSLPNFGDEKATSRAYGSRFGVSVLMQVLPDTPGKMLITDRRDSFCGKMSVCNNLRQFGIPYSLTSLHCRSALLPEFPQDLDLVRRRLPRREGALRNLARRSRSARGQAAFNTVRYSEKCWEKRHCRGAASTSPKSLAASNG
ncbi:MAG: hypothetical protein U5J83_08525 [Bryobacterales bacterium]|nr:hypothetical protein [Bryobacterales bacterium]